MTTNSTAAWRIALRRTAAKRKTVFGERGQGDRIARAGARAGVIARLCLALVLFSSIQSPAFTGSVHDRGLAAFAPSCPGENRAERAPDAPAPVETGRVTPHFCLACVACQIGGVTPAASSAIEMRVSSGAAELRRASSDRFDMIDHGALGWWSRAPPAVS